jgi:hypothetical protein
MADLHGVAPAILLKRGAHALGVIHRERHRLFLVDVLARGERIDKVRAVQVLRRGDQDRVDILVLEHAPVIEIRLRIGRDLLDVLEAACVDVRRADALHTFAADGLLQNLRAARAGSDDADADAIVGAQNIGRRQRSGESGGDMPYKITSRLHGEALLQG